MIERDERWAKVFATVGQARDPWADQTEIRVVVPYRDTIAHCVIWLYPADLRGDPYLYKETLDKMVENIDERLDELEAMDGRRATRASEEANQAARQR